MIEKHSEVVIINGVRYLYIHLMNDSILVEEKDLKKYSDRFYYYKEYGHSRCYLNVIDICSGSLHTFRDYTYYNEFDKSYIIYDKPNMSFFADSELYVYGRFLCIYFDYIIISRDWYSLFYNMKHRKLYEVSDGNGYLKKYVFGDEFVIHINRI